MPPHNNNNPKLSAPAGTSAFLIQSWSNNNDRAGHEERFQSILQGMRAITRPNGEPPRTLLQIIDDAIALENQFQRRQASSSSEDSENSMEDNSNPDSQQPRSQ